MSDDPTFIELAIDGAIMCDEIDDYVEAWHSSESELELHDFLGLSWQEYSLWVSHPDYIYVIIQARLDHQPVLEAVNDNIRSEQRLAARADEVRKLALLQKWIEAQPDR